MNKFFLFLCVGFLALNAKMIEINSQLSELDAFAYETPHAVVKTIPKDVKTVIVAFEKDTGALVNDFLNEKEPTYLEKHKAVYIADIHSMPSLVTKMFAIPKMKKYKHTIYLHNAEKLQAVVPNKEEKITIYRIKDGAIIDVRFVTTAKEIEELLEY